MDTIDKWRLIDDFVVGYQPSLDILEMLINHEVVSWPFAPLYNMAGNFPVSHRTKWKDWRIAIFLLDKAKLIETTIDGRSDMNLMSPVEGKIYTGNHGSSPSKMVNFPLNCPFNQANEYA